MATRRVGYSLLSAIGLLLAMSPWHCGWMALFSLVPWAIAVRDSDNWRESICHGAILGIGFYSPLLDWIRTTGAESVWNCSGTHLVAWVLLSGACSASLAVHSVLLRWLFARNCPGQLCLPIVFALHELILDQVLRRVFGGNSALVQLALTQVDISPLLQVADLGGAFLVTWFVALANGLIIDGLVFNSVNRHCETRRRKLLFLVGTTQLSAAIVYGIWRSEFTTAPGPSIGLATAYTIPRNANQPAPFVPALWIFPEDMSSTATHDADSALATFQGEASRRGCPILIGCRRFEEFPTPCLHNSLLLVSAERGLIASYDKRHLTPESETPSPIRSWLGQSHTSSSGWFAPGVSNTVCLIPGGQVTIGTGICHDACFSEWSRSLLNEPVRPDILVVCACERFDATGRVQQLLKACSQLRAVESRRPLIRCVQNGFSGVIDGCGRVSPGRRRSDFELAIDSVPLDGRTSLYSQIGDAGFVACLVLMLLVAATHSWTRSNGEER